MGHGAAHTEYTSATEISPHHFVYASCANNEWVDFKLTLSADDYHYNYLIEVEDLSDAHDPTALALYMYDYAIPNDRRSEQRAERAIDGIYSLAINRHNFHEGTSYISLNCRDAGPTQRRFRLVLYQIEEFLNLDKEYHGEVRPPDALSPTHLSPTHLHLGRGRLHLLHLCARARACTRACAPRACIRTVLGCGVVVALASGGSVCHSCTLALTFTPPPPP
jgi:hypothetical protein